MARLMTEIAGHEAPKAVLLAKTSRKEFFNGLILSGPEGIGKKKIARALLQELNCEKEEACGECSACLKIEKTADVFLHEIELQNDKIKIEAVRDVLQFASLKSWVKHRFVILNHVEKITAQAANALLKVLEEPPEGLHFIFITANLSQVLPTLRSRCQVIGFSPLSDEILREKVPGIEPWQVRWSFGRLSLAQKVVQEEWMTVRKSAINFLHSSQNKEIYEELQSQMTDPATAEFVMHSWMTYLRDAFLVQNGEQNSIYNQDIQQFVTQFAKQKNITTLFDEVFQFRQDLLANVDKTLLLDQFSIRLSKEHHAEHH
ncbi:AAA family ATPase [bacterium]|nr:AAA family ATPase [bacterium]